MTTIARSTKRHLTRRNQTPKRKPKQKPPRQNGNNAASPANARQVARIAPYDSANPRDGIPDLLEAPPTTEIIVHALFTAQHVIGELRYHFEMNNLTRGDMEMLAQLGKEIAAELDKE